MTANMPTHRAPLATSARQQYEAAKFRVALSDLKAVKAERDAWSARCQRAWRLLEAHGIAHEEPCAVDETGGMA